VLCLGRRQGGQAPRLPRRFCPPDYSRAALLSPAPVSPAFLTRYALMSSRCAALRPCLAPLPGGRPRSPQALQRSSTAPPARACNAYTTCASHHPPLLLVSSCWRGFFPLTHTQLTLALSPIFLSFP
jgi:hypothetical protein